MLSRQRFLASESCHVAGSFNNRNRVLTKKLHTLLNTRSEVSNEVPPEPDGLELRVALLQQSQAASHRLGRWHQAV